MSLQQLFGILGDAEVPLLQVALDRPRCRSVRRRCRPATCSFARTVWSFGHHQTAPGGPVGQTALQHLQEDPLVPVVVVGHAGRDLARPVDHRAHLPGTARRMRGDVVVGPGGGVDVVSDRGVLGRQAERIEAHREEHVVATHALQAGKHVRDGKGVPVTDVERCRTDTDTSSASTTLAGRHRHATR